MSSMEQVAEVQALMNEGMDLIRETGRACFEGERSNLRGLGANFLARAAQSYFSAGLLAEQGFVADAMSCGRTVVEMAIDFAYIALDPETRITRFAAYDDVHEFKLASNVAKHGVDVPQDLLDELKDRDRKFRDNNHGTKGNWSGETLEQRAKEADRVVLYEMPYKAQCNASHSGPGTLMYAVIIVDGEWQINLGPMTPDTHPMLCAFTAMMVLVEDVVKSCGLDPGLAARSNELAVRVTTLGELNPPAI